MEKIVRLWFKNIRNSFSQFITVVIIIFFGVAFLSGFLASSPNMKENLDNHLKKSNTWDIKIISPLGFKKDDLEKVKKITGISDIKFGNEIDTWIQDKEKNRSETRIFFYEEKSLNQIKVEKGRMTKSDDECVIEDVSNRVGNKDIGDKIKVKGKINKEYKIVGKVTSPNFLSSHGENTQLGIGKTYIGVYLKENQKKYIEPNEKTDEKAIRNLFGFGKEKILYLKIEKKKISIFDKTYDEKISEIKEKIEVIGKNSLKKTYERIKNQNLNWNIVSFNDTVGMSNFKTDVEKIDSISKVFPVFFFLVAFLVVTTTMTRMISDHRKEMGVLRCLGYSKRCIFIFYLTYGLFAAIIGTIIGIPMGFSLFPKFMARAYSANYNLPYTKTIFFFNIAIIVSLAVFLVIILTVTLVLRNTLKEIPAMLLLPKTPEVGKRILLEKIGFVWKRLRFSQKVTFRNIFRYKKRIIMTVVGVSGCMALLVAAFGLKDSIKNISDIQYNKINKYDIVVLFSEGTWKKKQDDRYKEIPLYMKKATVKSKTKNTIDSGDDELNLNVINSKEPIEDYIKFNSANSKESLKMNDSGILLSQKISEVFNVKKGDYIEVEIGKKKFNLKILEIIEYYAGNQAFLTKKYYEKITKENIKDNSLFLKINKEFYKGLSEDEREEKKKDLIEEIKETPEVNYIIDMENIKESFLKSINNIDGIIGVLVICAGMLTFIILYSMTNINVLERKKEISTIRVLGFYRKETKRYIFREIDFISSIGIIAGLPLGKLLHRFVITKIENGGIMLVREFSYLTYIYAVGIICIFVILTNLVIARKINKIDMVSAMKAND